MPIRTWPYRVATPLGAILRGGAARIRHGRHVKGRGVPASADYAGRPTAKWSRNWPPCVEFMQAIGYGLAARRLKSLDDLPAVEFDAPFTKGYSDACSNVRARRREDWGTPAPSRCRPWSTARRAT